MAVRIEFPELLKIIYAMTDITPAAHSYEARAFVSGFLTSFMHRVTSRKRHAQRVGIPFSEESAVFTSDKANGNNFFNFPNLSRQELLREINACCGFGVDTCERILAAFENCILEVAGSDDEIFVGDVIRITKMSDGGYQLQLGTFCA